MNDFCPICDRPLFGVENGEKGRLVSPRAKNKDGSLALINGKNWCSKCMTQYKAIDWDRVNRQGR